MSAKRNPLTIPVRDRVHCDQCGEIIDAKGIGNARAASGYVVNREAGGANTLALQVLGDSWLCRFCLADRRRGREWSQPPLFGEPTP